MKTYIMKMSALSIVTAGFIILSLSFPEYSLNGAVNGLRVCGEIIIPSLFPFCCIALFCQKSGIMIFLSKKISPLTQMVLHINGEQFCVFLMSLIGGYPVGMKLINELVEDRSITNNDAKRMSLYCVNCGPAFILTAIGEGLLGDLSAGFIILIANLIATVILLLIVELPYKSTNIIQKHSSISISDALVESVSSAATSIISICGWIILFSSLLSLLKYAPILNHCHRILTYLWEVTTACISANRNVPVISAIIGVGGFSVHCQVYSVGKGNVAGIIKFLGFRIIHALLSFTISFGILKICGRSINVISNNISFQKEASIGNLAASLSLIFMCIVFIASINKEKIKLGWKKGK